MPASRSSTELLDELEAARTELRLLNALERGRARAQGMRRSDELAEVAALVFLEFKNLGIELWRSGFWIIDTGTDTGEVWLTSTSGEMQAGDRFRLAEMDEHPAIREVADAFRRGDDFYHVHFHGDAMWSFLRFAIDRMNLRMPDWDVFTEGRAAHQLLLPHSFLRAWLDAPARARGNDASTNGEGVSLREGFWLRL
jgi:hypothetical protein